MRILGGIALIVLGVLMFIRGVCLGRDLRGCYLSKEERAKMFFPAIVLVALGLACFGIDL